MSLKFPSASIEFFSVGVVTEDFGLVFMAKWLSLEHS